MQLGAKGRWGVGAAALVAIAGGAWLSTGQPRLTVVNEGIDVAYPWTHGLGALLCAGGLLALGAAFRRSWLWVVSGVLAVVAAGVALHLVSYRLDATNEGIASRVMLRRTSIPWRDVQHVGSEATLTVVSGPGEREIAIDTTDFTPDQRLVLSRTITRRVNEASAARQSVPGPAH
jgi:hypothetical protein